MKKTFVFDFYNIFIPKGCMYQNPKYGVTIKPLKIAEAFEKNRTSLMSPFSKGNWKTAKCFIKADSGEEAMTMADNLQYIYSFAQGRCVFFYGYYYMEKRRKITHNFSIMIEPIENRFSDLIRGEQLTAHTYTRKIDKFVGIALDTVVSLTKDERKNTLATISAYLLAKTDIPKEVKFLIMWVPLEKLSSTVMKKDYEINQERLMKVKQEARDALAALQSKFPEIKPLIGKVRANYLYEPSAQKKVTSFCYRELGFKGKKLGKTIEELVFIRNELTHNLLSETFDRDITVLSVLEKILQQSILRTLHIDKTIEKMLVLSQNTHPLKENN